MPRCRNIVTDDETTIEPFNEAAIERIYENALEGLDTRFVSIPPIL